MVGTRQAAAQLVYDVGRDAVNRLVGDREGGHAEQEGRGLVVARQFVLDPDGQPDGVALALLGLPPSLSSPTFFFLEVRRGRRSARRSQRRLGTHIGKFQHLLVEEFLGIGGGGGGGLGGRRWTAAVGLRR